MIKTEIGYKNTLRHIKEIEEAIEEFHRSKTAERKEFSKLILEGPNDELKRLKAEIRDYERRKLKKAS